MKIAICSDSHDNIVNITTFLSYCRKNKIKIILHCGDWCATSVLRFFREKFKGEIYGVYGNVHADHETMQKFAKDNDIKLKSDEQLLNLRSVSVHHESQQSKRVHPAQLRGSNDATKIVTIITHYPDNAKKLAETGKYQIVFYGHNHKPWMEKINETYMINPGTLAGMFQRASFAVYDTETKKLELKIVDQIK
ncbi:MAG: YfcE family phosphodiesterase [Patescibacteria group bacterium]